MAKQKVTEAQLLRCINMAMGCISPLSSSIDERLAWYRLLDALEGREPRLRLDNELMPQKTRPIGP